MSIGDDSEGEQETTRWREDEEAATVDRNERVAAEVEEEQWEDATSGVATSA
jgi:hypothetical protein